MFLFFFQKFSEKLFNRAPVDGCFCNEKTCKTLNITSEISVEVHFLGKCEHFTGTDHLHRRYLRTRFRWLLLKFARSFSLKPFQLLWLKRNCYFDSKFCRILKKYKTCRNFFKIVYANVPLNTYYIKSSHIALSRSTKVCTSR